MYKFVVALCLVAVAAAQISNEYLPPVQEHHFEQPAPVHHFSAPAPVQHFSAPAPVQHFSAPAPVQHHHAAPVQQHHFSAPAPIEHFAEPSNEYLPPVSNHVDIPEPAHSFSQDDGYRYKTARRRVYRHKARVFRRRY